jgi:hypothetical protein
MFEYIDDETLFNDFKMLMKIPEYRASLFHKVEELKGKDENGAGKMQEFRELEKMVDPVDQEKETKKKDESSKPVNFEIEKVKRNWTVYPEDIPREIVNHIISHDLNPGEIKMEKFKLPGGKMIDLSYELQPRGCITGSIREKSSEKKAKQKTTKPAPSTGTGSKTEDLKILLTYLVNNEFLFNVINEEFLEKWKPLIDKGIINNEIIEG